MVHVNGFLDQGQHFVIIFHTKKCHLALSFSYTRFLFPIIRWNNLIYRHLKKEIIRSNLFTGA